MSTNRSTADGTRTGNETMSSFNQRLLSFRSNSSAVSEASGSTAILNNTQNSEQRQRQVQMKDKLKQFNQAFSFGKVSLKDQVDKKIKRNDQKVEEMKKNADLVFNGYKQLMLQTATELREGNQTALLLMEMAMKELPASRSGMLSAVNMRPTTMPSVLDGNSEK